MTKVLSKPPSPLRANVKQSREPEPAWDIARLFPAQGEWDDEDYLALDGNRPVEFSDGIVEVLPMPTADHQRIVRSLIGSLIAFTTPGRLGEVLFAPMPVQLRRGKFREPDVMFMRTRNAGRAGPKFWIGADLVMEVVSEDDESRRRDLVTKRLEYARARIGEYWIVDSREQRIMVLKLRGARYVLHGRFGPGERAASALLRGYEIDVAAIFAITP